MIITPLAIPEVILFEPEIFSDKRGFFFESFNQKKFDCAVGANFTFLQDNHSKSEKNVLRGLHYQVQQPQGKLVRVIEGTVFDVAVDIRKSSSTFGHWVGHTISAANRKQMWIPVGFAHGFVTLSDTAEFLYKTTDYWAPAYERCIRWDDRTLNITWNCDTIPIISDKDLAGKSLEEAEVFV